MLEAALQALDFGAPGRAGEGLVAVHEEHDSLRPDEGAVIRDVTVFHDVSHVFFRRFDDGRSSQPAAFVVDNTQERLDPNDLARLHRKLWLHGVAPLVYVAWPSRIDILSCARGPDFWKEGELVYGPIQRIHLAASVETALRRRFSAARLADGTFWDDPRNARFASHDKTAHESLIQAIVEVDAALEGETHPVFRQLLLLTILIKYLEDRQVFRPGWFGRFHSGARTFLQVLRGGSPGDVLRLLQVLERRFNGDIFSLPGDTEERLTRQVLQRFAELVEARTLGEQRYLWEQYSFEHLPVSVISHLYQRFVQGHGAVYTPPHLASLLLDYAMPYDRLTGNERILDPACGSGVFLVGAFRRLITVWQSRNQWQEPHVETLKSILERSIFGVELVPGAVNLAAFSLSLALCDALRPNVIWQDLRFDALRGRNLMEGDFFQSIADSAEGASTSVLGEFDVILGNPPFESRLSDAAQRVNARAETQRGKLPDKQVAYLFLEQSAEMLAEGGRICLIQPAGLFYNGGASKFCRHILHSADVDTILDFVSIRNLYDGADPKTVAVLAEQGRPAADHWITHLTFRRTFATRERIVFELDHYDRHRVSQGMAVDNRLIWRGNLLGGGRLIGLAERLRAARTLGELVAQQGWISGEGFIVGTSTDAPFLTGKPFLPTEALTTGGIDEPMLGVVEDTRFQRPRREELFRAPLVLIREHESLPCAFWNEGPLAYKHKIVGIHAPSGRQELRRFFDVLRRRRRQYRFCIAINGSQALIAKATAILKSDIEALPFPDDEAELDFAFWETALQDDVLDFMLPYVRLGQKSELLQRAAGDGDLASYADMFCRLLGSVYDNLKSTPPIALDGLICQPFYFGDAPEVHWLGPDSEQHLRHLVYSEVHEALRTIRVVRFYEQNAMLIVKPDRLRYWIRSTAICDADDTLADLYEQGY